MSLVLVGLLFILFRYDYAFFSQNIEAIVYIDVLPDFVGYLLIWFGLEKAANANRWYRESHTICTAMMIITFLSFLSQISFLFESLLQSPDGKIYAVLFAIVSYVVKWGSSLIYALTMIFMFMFSSALGYSMQQKERNVSTVLMYVFSISFVVQAVAYAINQFITLPFDLGFVSVPVGILFIVSSYFIMNKSGEL